MAAEKITPEAVNFMARYGRGLVCLALTEARCDELALPLMTAVNTSNYGTAFCESIDARRGTDDRDQRCRPRDNHPRGDR